MSDSLVELTAAFKSTYNLLSFEKELNVIQNAYLCLVLYISYCAFNSNNTFPAPSCRVQLFRIYSNCTRKKISYNIS